MSGDRKREVAMGCTLWLRNDLPYLIIHWTNICKGPTVSWGLFETQGCVGDSGMKQRCSYQLSYSVPCREWQWAQWLWNGLLSYNSFAFLFFLLSSISKLIQSKRQLLKSRYFILMWVIPIISYIKMSEFSCHPTGGRNVAPALFYYCMCICFCFVYGTWEAVAKLVLHAKCGNRSLKWDPDLT